MPQSPVAGQRASPATQLSSPKHSTTSELARLPSNDEDVHERVPMHLTWHGQLGGHWLSVMHEAGAVQSMAQTPSAQPPVHAEGHVVVPSGPIAMGQAGITHDDVGLLMIYDSFTITVLILLESLGFAPRGEGGRWVQEGHLRLGGKIPMTVSLTPPSMATIHSVTAATIAVFAPAPNRGRIAA